MVHVHAQGRLCALKLLNWHLQVNNFDKIQIQHNMQKVCQLSVHFRYTILYLAHGTNAWCEMIDVCKTRLKIRRGRDCAYIYTII